MSSDSREDQEKKESAQYPAEIQAMHTESQAAKEQRIAELYAELRLLQRPWWRFWD